MPNETPKPKGHEPRIFHMDANGNLVEGPPDAETLHRLLQEKLAEPTKATGVAPKPAAQAAAKPTSPSLSQALDPSKKRSRRYGEQGKTEGEILKEAEAGTMRSAIDKGIKEADE